MTTYLVKRIKLFLDVAVLVTLTPLAGFALSPGDTTALSNLVVQAKAAGITDTPGIYRYCVLGDVLGTTNVISVVNRPARVVAIEAALISLYTNAGLSASATMEDVQAAFTAIGSPTTAQLKRFIQVNSAWSELIRRGASPDVMTGLSTVTWTNTVPLRAAPRWSGPAITGADIEAVQ